MKDDFEFRPEILEYLQTGIRHSPDFEQERFVNEFGERISPEQIFSEIEQKTPLGIRLYRSAEKLYYRALEQEKWEWICIFAGAGLAFLLLYLWKKSQEDQV